MKSERLAGAVLLSVLASMALVVAPAEKRQGSPPETLYRAPLPPGATRCEPSLPISIEIVPLNTPVKSADVKTTGSPTLIRSTKSRLANASSLFKNRRIIRLVMLRDPFKRVLSNLFHAKMHNKKFKDASSLREYVIFSEILGKPKALKRWNRRNIS